MEFIVYAAGPIEGVSYQGCTSWRESLQHKFDDLLAGAGDRIRVASPMRAKTFLKNSVVTRDLVNGMTGVYEQATSSARAIMMRDYFDCTRADLVFVNLFGAKRSVGTIMEIAWAFHKPLVIVMEQGNPHHHPMIEEAGLVVPDFDIAVRVAANILLPNINGVSER